MALLSRSHQKELPQELLQKELPPNRYQSPPTSLPNQNRFTPLTPLALPSFYPSQPSSPSPRALRPPFQSKLVSPSAFTANVSSPSKNYQPEKLPFYTPPSSLNYPFVEKTYKKILFLVEPEYDSEESLTQITSKFFPVGFHYLPSSLEKTRLFYEFILVDSDSIELTHTFDKQDKNKIIFSKFKIMKVLSPSDWKVHPSQTRSFTRKFTPQHYSYYDYMDAGNNIMFFEPYDHSWFIWFKKDFPLYFPNWFIKWFHEWGPEASIYLDFAEKAFQQFAKETNIPDHMKILYFHASFGISWITTWNYIKDLSVPESNIYWMVRSIKIKWWPKFNPELIKDPVLQYWFTKNSKFLIKSKEAIKECEFLAEKSKFLADLSSSSNKKEFLKKLQAALSESDVNNNDDSASSSHSITAANEDDYFGNSGFPEL